MLAPEHRTDTASARTRLSSHGVMNAETAAIGLNDQDTLARSLSPELMLVDSELAERARELLREPGEANGKGMHMSALGTHEFTAGTSLGLEPPLSPPVVRGPMASALPADGGLSELPTPPPAIRPPESAMPAPVAAPAAPPAPAPEPAPAPPVPVHPEPGLPAMAPEPEAPVHDYFASETPAPAPAPEPEPAVELAPVSEPVAAPEQAVEVESIPLMAPAPAPEPVRAPAPAAEPMPVEEQVVELAPMAPAPQPEPVAAPAPQPAAVEPTPVVGAEPVLAPPAPEPVELVPEPVVEAELPVVEPVAAPEPEPVAEPALEVVPDTVPAFEELFAPKRATDFNVVVRLKDGEGVVEVGSFRDFGTAMEGAQEVIEQFSTATEGQWPFYAGRFIRPDLIVSVDVVEGDDS